MSAVRETWYGGRVPTWLGDALCAQTDPEVFYPTTGESHAAALRLCRACPVQNECLEHALDNDERFGIWGGQSERARRRLRRERKAAMV